MDFDDVSIYFAVFFSADIKILVDLNPFDDLAAIVDHHHEITEDEDLYWV